MSEPKVCNHIHIDERGFVYVDDLAVARFIPERSTLQFVDRDRMRSRRRGTRYVEIHAALLGEFVLGDDGSA